MKCDKILISNIPKKEKKMKTVGIICEYNPFHNGHKSQIDILRGMGFERMIMYLTGVANIRDVVPYPRTFGDLKY